MAEHREPLPAAEREALRRFRDGDVDGFTSLLRPHLGALVALARQVVRDEHWADDLVQETLVRAFRGLHGFRGESTLRSWLFRILIRLGSEPRRWQRQERSSGASVDPTEVPDALDGDPVTDVVDRELRDRLDEAVERLSIRQRTAFHLRSVEGLDYRAIADAMGCSVGSARMHVLSARRQIMERLGRYLEP